MATIALQPRSSMTCVDWFGRMNVSAHDALNWIVCYHVMQLLYCLLQVFGRLISFQYQKSWRCFATSSKSMTEEQNWFQTSLLLAALPLRHMITVSELQLSVWSFHQAAPLSSWMEANCLQSSTLGKATRLALNWHDAAYHLVFPQR